MKKVSYEKMAKLVNENCKGVTAKKSFWYGGAVCLKLYWRKEEDKETAVKFVNSYRTTSGNGFLIAMNRVL